MSESKLESLMDRLAAIDPGNVELPNMPYSVALQEAHDLAVLVKDSDVRAALRAVGLPKATMAGLPEVVDAVRESQSRWVVLRDKRKGDEQRQHEEEGFALRSDLLESCRWNLRQDDVAMATISAITEGDGIADLVQDLRDAAHLIESREREFRRDETFDAAESVDRARRLAAAIESGLSTERLIEDQQDAKLLRDRAFTYLNTLVSDIREAGRYAFRRDPALRSKFASAYLQRRRRRGRGDSAIVAPPPTEGTGPTE